MDLYSRPSLASVSGPGRGGHSSRRRHDEGPRQTHPEARGRGPGGASTPGHVPAGHRHGVGHDPRLAKPDDRVRRDREGPRCARPLRRLSLGRRSARRERPPHRLVPVSRAGAPTLDRPGPPGRGPSYDLPRAGRRAAAQPGTALRPRRRRPRGRRRRVGRGRQHGLIPQARPRRGDPRRHPARGLDLRPGLAVADGQ